MGEKEKKHGPEKISVFPAVFFSMATYVFTFLSRVGVQSVVYHELSALCRYLAWLCVFILFFNFMQRKLQTPSRRKAARRGGKAGHKRLAFLKKLLKKTAADRIEEPARQEATERLPSPQEDSSGSPAALSEQNVADPEGKLLSIPSKAPSEEAAPLPGAGKRGLNKMRALQIAYVLAVGLLTLNFITFVLENYPVRGTVEEFQYSLAHVAFMAFCTGVAFGLKKWFESGKEGKASVTAVSFFGFFGVLSLITSLVFAVKALFAINAVPVLFWIFMAAALYLAAAVSFRIVTSIIRHSVLSDFDFSVYIPFVTKSKNQKLLTMLEENTGLSLKSLWSLKYVAQIVPAAVLGTGALLLLATCVYKVEPYEQAVVYRLGALSEQSVKTSGIHFKAPWPIDKAELFEVERVSAMTVGYEATDGKDYLWTQSHGGEEYTLLLGGGNELVAVNVKLMYVIDDLYAYVTRAADAESILNAKAYEIMMEKTISTNLDTFLSVDRSGLAESLKESLAVFCDESKIGLRVDEVVIESIHPPVDIADTYQAVVSAGVQKVTKITEAGASALEKTAGAQKEAQTAIIGAQAKQLEKVAGADYEMAVYRAALEAYRTSPGAFKLYKYLSTYEKIIGENKVYVFFPNASADLSDYIINRSDNQTVTVIE
ncbi:MAG: hypothetical protein LBS36_03025 [Oscillospiraceae bacterium]|nr:hypothetical protein [Oscillospiraceae bacterium]